MNLALTTQDVFQTSLFAQIAFAATVALALVWLALLTFVEWRRRAMNLTSVSAARVNPGAQPDFLGVDHAGRSAALARGDAFGDKLTAREEAAAQADAQTAQARRSTGLISVFMSVFTLLSMITGAVWQVRWIGRYADELTTAGRLEAIVRAHPFAFTVSAVVISYHVANYVRERRWRRSA